MARDCSLIGVVNKSGERMYSCLVSDFRGKTFSLLLLSMMLAVGLPYMAFIMFRYVLSIFNLLCVFNHEKILNFVKDFSASIEMIV